MSADRAMHFESGKLWSLWDMLEIEAKPFIQAVAALNALGALMGDFVRNNREGIDESINASTATVFRRHLKSLREAGVVFDAINTVGEVDFISVRLRKKDSWRDLKPLVEGLNRIFMREVKGARLFALEPLKARYYGQASAVFGMEAVVAFPKAEYDLEEAGKCLAVARNTACVYHLMKAMETVLQALCSRIGVLDIDKRWGFLLADIDNAVKAMPKEEDKARWSMVRSNLWHVKEAWRNDTMHPGDKYTDAEASEVLEAVKVFIRSLSTMAASA